MAIENTNNTDFTNFASASCSLGLPDISSTTTAYGTVCFWAYLGALNTGSLSSMWQQSDPTLGSISLYIPVNTSNLYFAPNGAGVQIQASVGTGTWFWCGLSWNGNAMTGYYSSAVGGSIVTATGTLGGTWPYITTDYMKFFDSRGAGDFFKGYIAHFKCWNRVLSSAQLAYERDFRFPTRLEGLNRWHPMDETNLATALLDYTGRGFNLTHNTNGSGTLVYNASAPSGMLSRYVPLATVITSPQ